MRIGIDIRAVNGERAGIGNYVMGLVSGLSEIDHENNYLLINDQNFTFPALAENFQVKTITPGPGYHLQVAWLVKKENLVFHSTFSLIPPLLTRKKSVLTIHDLTAVTDPTLHTFKVRSLNKLLFKQAVKMTGHIITPTQVIKNQLTARVAEAEKKTTVIYDAVEDSFGSGASKETLKKYGLEAGYYLFNGTLEPRKNVSLLITAYAKLGSPLPLVLVGKKGWGVSQLVNNVKELNIEKQVRFLDWVPDSDLASLYQFATCLVYPSLQEGFGLSPLKAFKMGVPVIVSAIPVFKEVLGEAALYTDPMSADMLANLMKEISTPALRAKLIAAGFDRLNKYSWKKAAQETKAIYEELANETA